MRSLLVVEPKESLQRPLELVGAREVHRWNATRRGQLQVSLDGFCAQRANTALTKGYRTNGRMPAKVFWEPPRTEGPRRPEVSAGLQVWTD